jgi:uncharacterized protein YchJ
MYCVRFWRINYHLFPSVWYIKTPQRLSRPEICNCGSQKKFRDSANNNLQFQTITATEFCRQFSIINETVRVEESYATIELVTWRYKEVLQGEKHREKSAHVIRGEMLRESH